ncbi:MAG TPA: family 16 glycoside hydrolase, partial [Candidatus Acidoferrum sp.]|nr:family 16 glycoside hydrolase [Candidatus Acidoferrum sp.]
CFSPQQLEGEDPTAADDFYSFGATLYELLAGTPVFGDAKTLLSDMRSTSAPSLTERLRGIDSAVPAKIVEFVMACLDKDAAQRPTSFEIFFPKPVVEPVPQPERNVVPLELTDSFTPAQTALLKQTRAAVRKRSLTPWLVAACLMVLAVGAAGAWFVKRSGAEKQRLVAAQAETDRLRADAEKQKHEAALLAEKQQKQNEARLQMEAELKRKEDQIRLAAAAEQRSRAETTKAVVIAEPTKKVVAPLTVSATDEGFVSLFNGRDLSDWSGDTNYWSVMDGAITGQLFPAAPVKQRFYLTSTQAKVEDFEIQFSYRFRLLRGNRQPNGGVGYRAETNKSPELSSYQFDLAPDAKSNGAVNEDKRRYRMAGYGEAAIARSSDKSEVLAQWTGTNQLSAVRAEDWNQCVIIAKGNHITHYINGLMVADVVDEHAKKRHRSGLIALELHSKNTNNPATFLQFRDIRLKRLSKESSLAAAAK